jgi:hypothetical protein
MLYKRDGLVIVGGIQEKNKSSNMQLLFYRQEARENSGERAPYELKIDLKNEATTNDDYEMILNQAQVDSNAILRCLIIYEDSY